MTGHHLDPMDQVADGLPYAAGSRWNKPLFAIQKNWLIESRRIDNYVRLSWFVTPYAETVCVCWVMIESLQYLSHTIFTFVWGPPFCNRSPNKLSLLNTALLRGVALNLRYISAELQIRQPSIQLYVLPDLVYALSVSHQDTPGFKPRIRTKEPHVWTINLPRYVSLTPSPLPLPPLFSMLLILNFSIIILLFIIIVFSSA